MTTATGTFEVQPGAETPIEETGDGLRVTHATGTQRFSGDIEGEGSIDWLMCYLPTKSARFVGLQRITGTIGGRRGSVILEATGHHDGTGSSSTWSVIEGTGTGELTGIRGTGGFEAKGGATVSYRLDYELG
ncbi:MAG: DUF3224 domain-containing protein [Chloroflexota bacterium]